MRVRLLTAVALILTLSACYSAKPPAASAPGSVSPDTGIAPGIFPHKSGWKDPLQHGVYVKDTLAMDATACLACHKEIDSVSGGAPNCHSCHATFPHSEPGVTLDTHGDYVLKNGKAACATQCHGVDFKGGLSGTPCAKCHSDYPHPDGWSTPGVHGPAANGSLKNNCAVCHGADWNGGKSKVSCLNCHKGSYPHPNGWASPEQHGAFVSKNGTGKCATQCHGVQMGGGLSGKGCNDCHKVWPHPATEWLALHGQTARSIGLSGCTGCHKNDATGGKTGVTCAKCHTALPAHQDADWKTGGHGKLVMQQPAALTDPKGCPLCHGATLTGGKAPTLPGLKAVKGCNDSTCHATYPQLHKPAADAAAWNTYNGHGKWVMDPIKPDANGNFTNVLGTINDSLTACTLCHGSDLKGGNTGVGCYNSKCHSNFPHNMDAATTPWLSKHGAAAMADNPQAASCATANCHGQDLQGLPAGEKIVAKKRVKGCTDCHLQMPHPPLAQWDHGKSVTMEVETVSKSGVKTKQTLLDVSKCVTCHGGDWTGGTSKTSCYGCHATFPAPHRDAGGALSTTWKPATGHGKTVMDAYKSGSVKDTAAAPCKICHGSDLTGGASGKTCYKCHKSFPHPPAGINDWKTQHSTHINAQAVAKNTTPLSIITSDCAPCHISGAQNDCKSCHHQNAPGWNTKGKHDVAAVANIAGCKSCHGPDLKGTTIAPSCATCHGPGMKATLASHQDITEVQTYFTQCCDNCLDGDWDNCSDCANNAYYNCGPPKQQTVTLATFVPKLHSDAAKVNTTPCKICHGDDFKGGISGQACFSCHNPGGKYPHTKLGPNTIQIWQDQIKTQTVPVIAALKGDMFKNCYTACHNWIVVKADGTKVFPDPGDCLSCHSGFK